MATVTTKDAVIALLESQLYDLKTEASPISDFFVPRSETFRFDITLGEIKRYMRHRVTYRPCPRPEAK